MYEDQTQNYDPEIYQYLIHDTFFSLLACHIIYSMTRQCSIDYSIVTNTTNYRLKCTNFCFDYESII